MRVWLAVTVIALCGCKRDIGNSSWDVDVLAPVIRTELTMADLLADSLLEANADGLLRLKVEVPLINLPLDSILQIPDTTIENEIAIAFNFSVPPGVQLPTLSDATKFNLGEVSLSTIVLRTGKVKLSVSSTLETEIDFIYRINGAQKFGVPFEALRTLAAGSTVNPTMAQFEFDLKGYTIDLRGENGSGFNTLQTDFIIKTSETGDTIAVTANTPFFFLEYSFFDIVPNFASGYFGQQTSEVEQESSQIDVLNRITDGQMFLDSVTIGLTISNGVGTDARFNLERLSSINTRTNTTIELSHAIVDNNILLTRAQDPTGNSEDVITSELKYTLDNSNSNVKQFIENLPNGLGYKFNFELNPLGNISAGNDFFYFDSPFEALMNIDIPLRTTLIDLTLVDTVDWNLTENAAVESVNSGSFTLVANNGFPLEALVELILLDENQNRLDTLLVPSTIMAPTLDANNKVVAPLETRINIPVPDKTRNILARTKSVRIRVRFNTAAQPHLIEFYDTYGIDLKIIGNLNINFGPSTL